MDFVDLRVGEGECIIGFPLGVYFPNVMFPGLDLSQGGKHLGADTVKEFSQVVWLVQTGIGGDQKCAASIRAGPLQGPWALWEHLGEPRLPGQVPMAPETSLCAGHRHCNPSVSSKPELPR